MDIERLRRLAYQVRHHATVAGLAEPSPMMRAVLADLDRFVADHEPPDDALEAPAGEPMMSDAEPTLGAVLRAAREHCISVTFVLSDAD